MLIQNVEGLRIPARFTALACTLEPVPEKAFDAWPAGRIRVREAEVRASPPAAAPGVVEHAPVIVQTLHPEAFVTLDPECRPPHAGRLRVQLDAVGVSPRFYLCFSDLGGAHGILPGRRVRLSGRSARQRLKQAHVIGQARAALHVQDVVEEDIQPSLGGDPRIELPD
jgi:hypothetical protein